MDCQIIRKKLIRYGVMSIVSGTNKSTGERWVTEKCGVPIFGNGSHERKVCDGCLEGWTDPENSMVEGEFNRLLLSEAIKDKL